MAACCALAASESPPWSTGFVILFGGEGEVTATQVIGRSIGGSFIFCGLIAWQRRPDNRTGQLMTLTGFLFQAVPLRGRTRPFPTRSAR